MIKEVRADCKRLSKCGMRSVQWCRSFRDYCDECKDCKLIHHINRENTKIVNGVELRRCCTCGQFLPLNRFYKKKIVRGNKVYQTYTSQCDLCISHKNHEVRKRSDAHRESVRA